VNIHYTTKMTMNIYALIFKTMIIVLHFVLKNAPSIWSWLER